MEYQMIYSCWGLQANDNIDLKWYTLVEDGLLNDGCGVGHFIV